MSIKELGEKLVSESKGCRVVQSENDARQRGRQALYVQHFSPQVRVNPPAGFIKQVNGYGVQVFSQASSFAAR